MVEYNGKRLRKQEKFQYCTYPSGDPSLQDNVLIPNDFFEYTSYIGCAINLHSIMNSGLIPGGQILSKRQTVFFLPVDPMEKEHRDPNIIDLEAPRLAWYHQKKWTRHQDTVYCVDIKLAQKKGFKFYQTTIERYHSSQNIIMMETGEIMHEKVFASPRPPPKMSFKDNWMKELGSEVALQACEHCSQIQQRVAPSSTCLSQSR